MRAIRVAQRQTRTDANIAAFRRSKEGEIVFGMRTGLLGHPTTTVLRLYDTKLVGAMEDVRELGEVVTQVGLLTLAALFRYNLAWGPEGLAAHIAKWAKVDVEALQKAAAAEPDKVAETDEDGDTVVRPADESTAVEVTDDQHAST